VHKESIGQLNVDIKARRDVLEETQDAMGQLSNLLQDLHHTTDKMRQLYWE
jgi:uncharacterized protein YukE